MFYRRIELRKHKRNQIKRLKRIQNRQKNHNKGNKLLVIQF